MNNDISKCPWKDCKLKTMCKRYIIKSSELQSWTQWEFKDNTCDLFIKYNNED